MSNSHEIGSFNPSPAEEKKAIARAERAARKRERRIAQRARDVAVLKRLFGIRTK